MAELVLGLTERYPDLVGRAALGKVGVEGTGDKAKEWRGKQRKMMIRWRWKKYQASAVVDSILWSSKFFFFIITKLWVSDTYRIETRSRYHFGQP